MNNSLYHKDVLLESAVSCSLSIVGGTVILASYYILPEIRNFTRKLVVCLTVADLLTAMGYLVSAGRFLVSSNVSADGNICKIQSTITTYSSLVSFFLTSIIAIYIFDTVQMKKDRLGSSQWLVFFNALSWGVPAVIVGVALSRHAIGEDTTTTGGTGPWCWIKVPNTDDELWMWLGGKGWEIACYLITTTLYILLKVRLWIRYRRVRFHDIHISLRDEDQNFLLVWLLLYLVRVWGTSRFLIYVIAVEQPQSSSTYIEVLLRLQALGDPAQAFCNFILFCVCDKTVRTKLCPFACRFSFKRREIAEESVNRRVGMGSPVHWQIMDPSSS